ncbi:hypothetical protein RDI58_020815 [Solanum bulbocastanum]|uniref:Uncharacterized protein n=1 Tax=Solanum bulbocastanum TaxID=147425 RepID=A0AAN8TAL2_SOLBU
MRIYDLRYIILLLINIFKSTSSDWDPFHLLLHYDSDPILFSFIILINKILLVVSFSFIFSIISIRIIHMTNYSNRPISIEIQFGTFSKCFSIFVIVTLLLPQVLFWYIFFIIILFSLLFMSCSNWISNLWEWTLHILSAIPVLTISIRAQLDNNAGNNYLLPLYRAPPTITDVTDTSIE